MSEKKLQLKKKEERRVLSGHLWVFANEVDVKTTPLVGFVPGEEARLVSASGRPIGSVYVNPASLICARLFSLDPDASLSPELLRERLGKCLSLRTKLFDRPFFRLVYGESDFLPGMVADLFGTYLAVRISTAGMERQKGILLDVFREMLEPLGVKGVFFRCDDSMRTLEGLPEYREYISFSPAGSAPEEVEIEENGCVFRISPLSGQKTGWFFDQRANRLRAARYVRGESVLDLFSYLGGFGVLAAVSGASAVTCVDSSEFALRGVRANAAANGVEDKVEVIDGDCFEVLRAFRDEGRRYGTVILDPPALIKRKKDFREGLGAYMRLNQLAMRLLNPGGILVTSTCSHHLSRDEFLEIIGHAAHKNGLWPRVLEEGGQAEDHPVLPAMPETRYLKTFVLSLEDSREGMRRKEN